MASATWLRAQAASCRRVADEVESPSLHAILLEVAEEYERDAELLLRATEVAGTCSRVASEEAAPEPTATDHPWQQHPDPRRRKVAAA